MVHPVAQLAGLFLLKQAGILAMRTIVRWLLPRILDMLSDAFKAWVDDPDTQTDDAAIESVSSFLKYLADKKLS